MNYNKIIIDAMGGDNAPEEIMKGAIRACQESASIHCTFVGDPEAIMPYLEKSDLPDERWSIEPATDIITMDDHPKEAVKEKDRASINVATRLIRDHKGDALVSAGNTGATILSCSLNIPRMPGVERGVLAAILPAAKNKSGDPGFCIMLDVGATLHCTVSQLVSFAIMGVEYTRKVMAVAHPRVGLLNIGEEDTKGHDTLIETNKALKSIEQIDFIGNVEGKDIMRGICDVIVTEGLTGNIVLKCLEGMAEMTISTGKRIWKKNLLSKLGLTMLSPILKKLKKRMDYSEYGGAPILGFQKLIIKAHGRSKSKAIKNAVLLAEKSIANDLVGHMEGTMKDYYLHMFNHDEDAS
jgi:glycerol-3-phosphate acyltransferase PlsX